MIESELDVSAKEHHKNSTQRHLLGIISLPILCDITGIQDVSSSSPEYRTIPPNEFLDQYPLPTNARVLFFVNR